MPVITKIERQKRSSHRVSVYLDDEFAFGLNDEAVYRHSLKKGMEMSAQLRDQLEESAGRADARLIADRFLSTRMRTEKEIRDKLATKEIRPDIIDETIESLKRSRLVDDRLFAEMFVNDRLRFRPRGRALLQRELRFKGVNGDTAAEVVDAVLNEGSEQELAAEMARLYSERHSGLERDVLRRRLVGWLQRRGFPSSAVYAALRRTFEQ